MKGWVAAALVALVLVVVVFSNEEGDAAAVPCFPATIGVSAASTEELAAKINEATIVKGFDILEVSAYGGTGGGSLHHAIVTICDLGLGIDIPEEDE